jgi:hypothetical protein
MIGLIVVVVVWGGWGVKDDFLGPSPSALLEDK